MAYAPYQRQPKIDPSAGCKFKRLSQPVCSPLSLVPASFAVARHRLLDQRTDDGVALAAITGRAPSASIPSPVAGSVERPGGRGCAPSWAGGGRVGRPAA
jgi:hypothetical protein